MTTSTVSLIATARAYTALPAEDLDRARRFYHEALGFCVEDLPPARQFLIHAGGETRILVYETTRTKATHTSATFVVEDLDPVIEDMRSRGARFEDYNLPELKTEGGVAVTPLGRGAWFADSEGNIISVIQPSSPLGGLLAGEPICV